MKKYYSIVGSGLAIAVCAWYGYTLWQSAEEPVATALLTEHEIDHLNNLSAAERVAALDAHHSYLLRANEVVDNPVHQEIAPHVVSRGAVRSPYGADFADGIAEIYTSTVGDVLGVQEFYIPRGPETRVFVSTEPVAYERFVPDAPGVYSVGALSAARGSTQYAVPRERRGRDVRAVVFYDAVLDLVLATAVLE